MTHAADAPDNDAIYIVIGKDGEIDIHVNPAPAALSFFNNPKNTPAAIAKRIGECLEYIHINQAAGILAATAHQDAN